MSENTDSANGYENSEKFREIAAKFLKQLTTQSDNIARLDDLVNLIIEHYLRELRLPTFPAKIESDVQLHLTEEDASHLTTVDENDLWIFGYGSLVWKADFPFVARRIGYIKGFERRFYQNSIDHRGTPEKPGRVVTLIPSSDPNSQVWGVAYRIATADREDVIRHLDFREKNGYERHKVNFYPYSPDHGSSFSPQSIIIYVATENNVSFAGHINDLDQIAEQAYNAVGPSGTNREYVYKLANAMRQLFPGEKDEHLFALEQKLRHREARDRRLNQQLKDDITAIVKEAVTNKAPKLEQLEALVSTKFDEFRKNIHNNRANHGAN